MDSRFTLKNLLAMTATLALLCCLVGAKLQQDREAARLKFCVKNLKNLGRGLHHYHDATNRFPSSAGEPVSTLVDGAAKAGGNAEADGGKESVKGTWSWSSRLLPFLGQKPMYDAIIFRASPLSGFQGGELPETLTVPNFNTGIVGTKFGIFRCPSYTGPQFAQAYLPKYKMASTNYVALGATTQNRLWGKDADQPPAPDGAIYPKSRTRFRDFIDGSSNTVVIAETIEPNWSAWADGASASTFALWPRTIDEDDFVRVTMEDSKPLQRPYQTLTPAAAAEAKTTIALKRSETLIPAAKLPFGVNPQTVDKKKSWQRGPSSEHADVVNHLFGDGAVRGIRRDIDANVYLYLVTKRGRDRAILKEIFGNSQRGPVWGRLSSLPYESNLSVGRLATCPTTLATN